jgi:hypothetical protein
MRGKQLHAYNILSNDQLLKNLSHHCTSGGRGRRRIHLLHALSIIA